jgi:hypothetical protein
MSEPADRSSADNTEQPEVLVGRREVVGEALTRFAKYTAPVMLAVLMSTSHGKARICTISTCGPP